MPTVCSQCNVNVSVRVASPGDNGDVSQANTIVAAAASATAATTAAAPAGAPAVPVPGPPVPLAFTLPSPPVPPVPVVVAPPLPPAPPGATTRVLADARAPARAAADGEAAPRHGGRAFAATLAAARTVVVRGSHDSRVSTHTFASAEAHVFSRVVVTETRHTAPARAKRTAQAPRAAAAMPPARSPAPSSPPGPAPAAAASTAAGAHGSGGFVLAAALAGAAGVAIIALLSGIVPTSVPARRRLSDDRRGRPG